ncbi:MAG TPA: HEPN domain-containing protein [Phycisphaerae bacterium]|nr:HEPN domain-containing protein [Phycisphaerae bacterium]
MPPKHELVQAWLRKARNDLITGERALGGQPSVRDTACFHAQQAVEKALKALMVFREVEPPRTHHIGLLLKQCGTVDARLSAMSKDLKWLTSFAVDVHYADVGDEPTVEQARNALLVAQRAVEIILAGMPEEARP